MKIKKINILKTILSFIGLLLLNTNISFAGLAWNPWDYGCSTCRVNGAVCIEPGTGYRCAVDDNDANANCDFNSPIAQTDFCIPGCNCVIYKSKSSTWCSNNCIKIESCNTGEGTPTPTPAQETPWFNCSAINIPDKVNIRQPFDISITFKNVKNATANFSGGYFMSKLADNNTPFKRDLNHNGGTVGLNQTITGTLHIGENDITQPGQYKAYWVITYYDGSSHVRSSVCGKTITAVNPTIPCHYLNMNVEPNPFYTGSGGIKFKYYDLESTEPDGQGTYNASDNFTVGGISNCVSSVELQNPLDANSRKIHVLTCNSTNGTGVGTWTHTWKSSSDPNKARNCSQSTNYTVLERRKIQGSVQFKKDQDPFDPGNSKCILDSDTFADTMNITITATSNSDPTKTVSTSCTINAGSNGCTYELDVTDFSNSDFKLQITGYDTQKYLCACPDESGSCYYANATSSQNNVENYDFYLTNKLGPTWIVSYGGSITFKDGINIEVPNDSSIAALMPNLRSTQDSSGFPFSLGTVKINKMHTDDRTINKNTIVKSYIPETELSYSTLLARANQVDKVKDLTTNIAPSSDGMYIKHGDLVISSSNEWDIKQDIKKLIVFVEGNLNISGNPDSQVINIEKPSDTFVMFVVKGDINISADVGNTDPTDPTPNLTGVFISDQKININSSNTKPDNKIVIYGTMYAKNGFSFGRKLDNEVVDNAPFEIIYSPSFVLLYPDELKSSNLHREETNPTKNYIFNQNI